jgi:hypothetical protein
VSPGAVIVGTHAPLTQLCPEGQALLHAPQCAAVLVVLVSQPLDALLSQLPRPTLQAPTPHAPPAQVCIATFERLQTAPHPPQFAGSTWVLTSQPFTALLSQFAKPALHEIPHALDAQVAAAFVRAGQTVLHAPQ